MLSSYSTYLLLHNILRLPAADDCEIVITAENVGPAVRAAQDLLDSARRGKRGPAGLCGALSAAQMSCSALVDEALGLQPESGRSG